MFIHTYAVTGDNANACRYRYYCMPIEYYSRHIISDFGAKYLLNLHIYGNFM
jgi:hypothetical protein